MAAPPGVGRSPPALNAARAYGPRAVQRSSATPSYTTGWDISYEWALRFEQRAKALMMAHKFEPLIHYENMGRDALLSVPTPDHYLPLLYVLGTWREGDPIAFPAEGVDGGSISMLAVSLAQFS